LFFFFIDLIFYFLSEIVFRAVGGATGAFTAAGAFKPDGFQTRGGAAFNLGTFLTFFFLSSLYSLEVIGLVEGEIIFPKD